MLFQNEFIPCKGIIFDMDGLLRDVLPAQMDAMNFKDEWGEHYRERLADTVPVKPGVADVIEQLAGRNIPMAAATSSQGEKAQISGPGRTGMAAHVLVIAGANADERGKPAPDVYPATIEKLVRISGITAVDDYIAFEDSKVGVRAALTAGLCGVQIPGLVPVTKPSSSPSQLIADTLATGIRWLKIDNL